MGEAKRRQQNDPTWGKPAPQVIIDDPVSEEQKAEAKPPVGPKLLSGRTWQQQLGIFGKVTTVRVTPWRRQK